MACFQIPIRSFPDTRRHCAWAYFYQYFCRCHVLCGAAGYSTLPPWLASVVLCFPVILGIIFGWLIIQCGVKALKETRKEMAEAALREKRVYQRITSGVFAAVISAIIFFCAIKQYFTSPTVGLVTLSYVAGTLYLYAAGAWLLLAVQTWRTVKRAEYIEISTQAVTPAQAGVSGS